MPTVVNAILNISIMGGVYVVCVFALLTALFCGVVFRRQHGRWNTTRWATAVVLLAFAGAVIGWAAVWLVSDVLNTFGVALTAAVHGAAALVGACTAVAILGLSRRGWWRRTCALLLIPMALLAGASIVNIDFGQYATLRDALGVSGYSSAGMPQQIQGLSVQPSADWSPPANLAAHGRIVEATIPATTSHFDARSALVYLPPAALVANPPLLPVVVVLSGQPGSPDDVFDGGHLDVALDAAAAQNRGITPIIVVPDQLGSPDRNPMCVDSALGNSASYMTVDVPNWIRSTLNVLPNRTSWAIAGFSQGGTCAVQIGAAHPELFGSFVAVSPELAPSLGSVATTIDQGFAGSKDAYAAAQPLSILSASTPYSDSEAIFAVGENDATFRRYAEELSAAAEQAGITTTLLIAPGTAHDWYTGGYGLVRGIAALETRLGIGGAASG